MHLVKQEKTLSNLDYQSGYYITPFDFGAKGDGIVDDTVALQNFLNEVQGVLHATEGPTGTGYCPAGYKFKITDSLRIYFPCDINFRSMIEYSSVSGPALIIDSDPTLSRNTNYRLSFCGFRATNGNNSIPTLVNYNGNTGIEIRCMHFSVIEISKIIGFTGSGIYFNSTNDRHNNQHVQHNKIEIGECAYNGCGIRIRSVSAEFGATQANFFLVQDVFANYRNIDIDAEDLQYLASSSNIFHFLSMDRESPGGTGLRVNSSYNRFLFAFVESSLHFMNSSFHNICEIANNKSTGVTISDEGTRNWISTTTPNENILPAQFLPEFNVVYKNEYGVAVSIYGDVNITPTTSDSEVVTVKIGFKTTNLLDVMRFAETAQSPPTASTHGICFIVPPGYYWSLSKFGSGQAILGLFTAIQSSI